MLINTDLYERLYQLWSDYYMSVDKNYENDPVNNPSHYTYGNIECIDAIESSMSHEAFCGFLKGNCLKYIWRFEYKGKAIEDLEKAKWYLNKLIEYKKKE